MRNAAATFDDDLGFDPPARRKPTRKPGSSASGKKKKKGRKIPFDRVARVAAIGMSATVVVGIMVNALMMQKGHHPAPLFAKSTPLFKDDAPAAAPAAAQMTSAPIVPAAGPAAIPAAKADGATKPSVAKPAPAPSPPKVQRTQAANADARTESDDVIARLLKTGAPSASAEKSDAKTVLSVQKALAKLGFPVKATGTAGPATKKAIEAFEKDRNLPVKGELSHRLVKTLAAESGQRID